MSRLDPAAAVGMTSNRAVPRLHRVLGLWEVTASGVGIIIGAGIYVLIGAATAQAGPAVWVAFLLTALVSALTALSYAELAARFPSAAGEFEYTHQVFPPWVAFLVGWAMIAGLVVAAAAVSLGFARYLGYFVPIEPRLGAFALIAFVTALAVRGIKQSARVTFALSAVQIGGLLLVIGVGLSHLGEQPLMPATSVTGVLGAAALIFFAYIGFDEVITLSEETVEPTRTVPRALLLALGISTVLYIGTAIAAVSVLGAPALAASPRPLTDVIGYAIGEMSAAVMAALAIVATTNTTLLALIAASRLTFGMASHRLLPAALTSLHPQWRSPMIASLLAALVAAGFVLLGDLTLIASVTDFAVYLVFLVVNATVVRLRWREPLAARGFRVPLQVGRLPVLPCLAFGSVLLMMTQLEGRAIAIGVGLCAVGALAALLVTSRVRLTDPEQSEPRSSR